MYGASHCCFQNEAVNLTWRGLEKNAKSKNRSKRPSRRPPRAVVLTKLIEQSLFGLGGFLEHFYFFAKLNQLVFFLFLFFVAGDVRRALCSGRRAIGAARRARHGGRGTAGAARANLGLGLFSSY